MLALVLGGGNAVGAYHGGVVSALETAGVQPNWVAGSSIGAVMGALIAGNPPGRRTAAVREFWRRGEQSDGPASWVSEAWRKVMRIAAALRQWREHPPAARGLAVHNAAGIREMAAA